MTTEDRTAPIRALLAKCDGKPRPRPKLCGGAIVPVTRDSVKAIERRFDVDLVVPDDAPEADKFDARVACSDNVLESTGVGGAFQYATCARCAGIEQRVRAVLAEAAARVHP